jgi:hypothetical protein
LEEDRKRELIRIATTKITAVFALVVPTSLFFAFAQGNDPANEVLQTERDLANAYQKGDVDTIAQGVMEDYTLTNSTGKITTRLTTSMRRRKKIPNTKSLKITT